MNNFSSQTDNVQDKYMQLLSSGTSAFLRSTSSTLSKDRNRDLRVNECSQTIIDFVLSEEYVEGQISKTQLYIESIYCQDKSLLRDSFQKSWLAIYSRGEYAVYTFISIASSIEYEFLEDRADTLIFAGYAHASEMVNEATIRAIESWEQPSHISLLEQMKPFTIVWLEEYKNSVIDYLKSL